MENKLFQTNVVWIGKTKYSNDVYHQDRWKLEWGSTCFKLLGIIVCVYLNLIIEINVNLKII